MNFSDVDQDCTFSSINYYLVGLSWIAKATKTLFYTSKIRNDEIKLELIKILELIQAYKLNKNSDHIKKQCMGVTNV